MNKNLKGKSKGKKVTIFMILILILGSWAGLTKAGYIPNFTNLEILCSGDNETINNTGFSNGLTPRRVGLEVVKKPVIYLYPQKKQKIKVELNYNGKIIADYPEYDYEINGWEVEAYPDSKIIDLRDGKEYSYIFWEGVPKDEINWDLSTGFIVKGENSREFLREKLEYLGLTPKEYNEFIVFWYPKMMNNKYNLVHFVTKRYTENAPLRITPKPDSMLRVFMIMKPLEEKIYVKEQKLQKFERNGFSVIEWGGTELR